MFVEYRKIALERFRPTASAGSHCVAAREPDASMAHRRLNQGLLAEPERRALRWLAQRTPEQVRPDHLTGIGVAGAVLVMVGFICANASPWFAILVVLGLLLNWFGDSLDGTLARYRRIERPRMGYFIDHSCDLISQAFIFIGLGISPYFTLTSALFALSMYLLISSYTYIKVMILRTHHLSYGGMGATELRVAIVCWTMFAIGFGPALVDTKFMDARVLDIAVGVMWTLVFVGFIVLFRSDLAKFRDVFGDCEVSSDEPARISGLDAVRKRDLSSAQPIFFHGSGALRNLSRKPRSGSS